MTQGILVSLQETPYGYWMFGAGAAALLVGAAMSMLASRRRRVIAAIHGSADGTGGDKPDARFSLWVELGIVASLFVVPLFAIFIIEHSRALMLSPGQDPSNIATNLAIGVSGQLNAIFLASLFLLLHLPIAGVGLGFALTYRNQAKQPAGQVGAPAIAAVLTILGFTELALSPLLLGVMRWLTVIIKTSASVAGIDPDQKAVLLLEGLDEAQPILAGAAMQSSVGLLLMAIIASVVVRKYSHGGREDAGSSAAPATAGLSNGVFFGLLACCLAGSIIFLALAMPYYQENRQPMPFTANGSFYLEEDKNIVSPALDGPDILERSPLLALTGSSATKDGHEVESAAALTESLQSNKHNYELVHPDVKFPGKVVLQADKNIAMLKIRPYLRAVLEAGYSTVQLAFRHIETISRPVFGDLRLDRSSGARIRLVEDSASTADQEVINVDTQSAVAEGGKTVVLRTSDRTTYEKLATVAVAARKRGRKVILPLPESPEAGKDASAP